MIHVCGECLINYSIVILCISHCCIVIVTTIPVLAAELTNEGICSFLFGKFDPHLAVGLRHLHACTM